MQENQVEHSEIVKFLSEIHMEENLNKEKMCCFFLNKIFFILPGDELIMGDFG